MDLTDAMASIDLISCLVTDELTRRSERLLERRRKQAAFRDPSNPYGAARGVRVARDPGGAHELAQPARHLLLPASRKRLKHSGHIKACGLSEVLKKLTCSNRFISQD